MARTTTNEGAAQHAAPSFPFLTGKVAVTVSEHWIERGRVAVRGRMSLPCNCPVSHAVADAGFDNARVSTGSFTSGPAITDTPRRRIYALPQAAQRFIERFDADEPVAPFTFEVDADDYVEVADGNDLARLEGYGS